MINDIRKSINSILYERTTSPFWGSLIISWVVWNWKIVYLTFCVGEESIKPLTKIDYIISNNYLDYSRLYLYPIISSFLLIALVPFLSNGAFWLSLKFKQWRILQKDKIEGDIILPAVKSNEIKLQMLKLDREYSKTIITKESDIKVLKGALEKIEKSNSANNLKSSEVYFEY